MWYNDCMDVADLVKKAEKEADTDIMFNNPLMTDFTVNFNNQPYTAPALRISTFKKPIADHIKKHLVNEILNQRNIKHTETEILKVYKEIEDLNLET